MKPNVFTPGRYMLFDSGLTYGGRIDHTVSEPGNGIIMVLNPGCVIGRENPRLYDVMKATRGSKEFKLTMTHVTPYEPTGVPESVDEAVKLAFSVGIRGNELREFLGVYWPDQKYWGMDHSDLALISDVEALERYVSLRERLDRSLVSCEGLGLGRVGHEYNFTEKLFQKSDQRGQGE